MADDVCDSVGLACPRRSLNGHTRSPLQLLHDGHLLIVVGQREIQLLDLTACSRCPTSRQPTECNRLKPDRLIRWLRYECERTFMDSATSFELLLQALEIFEKVVDGSWSGEQYPRVRYDKGGASRRSQAILIQNSFILALAVQVAGDRLEHVRVLSGIEWRR